MRSIAFVDTEVDPKKGRILDIGSIKDAGASFHETSVVALTEFLRGTEYICGHNILNHDVKYIGKALRDANIHPANIVDTLYLSPLLFPTRPYHALVKDDKLQTEEANNPLNDSIKARDLFHDEVAAFHQLDEVVRQILYLLLHDKKEFQAFFRFVGYSSSYPDAEGLIRQAFESQICEGADLARLISAHAIELAYCLALVHANHRYSITPPWVLKNYPEVQRVMYLLRNKPCLRGCAYCDEHFNIYIGLKRFFGFDSYRTYGGEPLQEQAVRAAVDNKSLLAIFPTGGGKSITFQVPALMSGENAKGLTVIISPLQSLMKDQVDNLEKSGITEAVTINGLLDPIERAKSFERVEDGSASILYLSPESLRSKTIERLIVGRNVVRFVIDEAHCFSSWGQDFRVDYLYIGDFIKSIQEKKNLQDGIPVSCFTATAKQQVIADIRDYFRDKLGLELELFTSKASRTNLQYKVVARKDEEEKYQALRLLLEEKDCPTIIYVSRTGKADMLAKRLTDDGFSARSYHGQMEVAVKTANQDAFISGETSIMVATSAFGMGVDKKDVGMVIHYEISDSLENYVQEAGRAGRDESIRADCYVLFNEEDLGKHFLLLNQTKLSIKEIQQVWKAIKGITKFRSKVSNSALEIARKAGWDESVYQIETRVKTAIAALEEAGYLKRGQNVPRVYADSIQTRNAQEAIDKINASERFEENQKTNGIRIIKSLFSSKSRKQSDNEVAESRIDYISDHLGIVKEEVISTVNLLREEEILADAKDLTAFIKKGENHNRSLSILKTYSRIELFLLPLITQEEQTFHIKELNEQAEEHGCEDVTPARIKTVLNFWTIKYWINQRSADYSKNHVVVLGRLPQEDLKEKLTKRHELAQFIVELLYERANAPTQGGKETDLVEFSVHELKAAFENAISSFGQKASIQDIEDALFYLSRIDAIKIEGGFLVVYNRLTIERTEEDNKKRYTKDDYSKLERFYDNKVQQIHIVGEYAKRMLDDYREALQFVEDYFQLNYSSFLRKYFPGSKANELKLKMTPGKFKQLFGELSPRQLKIINDKAQYMVVAAGPGSGKTKVLVHKLASLLLMEDVKHEQLLMVTFSRAAATEFKKRLLKLIGNAANFVEIKTFHSYCFDLLGRVGTLEKSSEILKRTIEKIKKSEVEASRIAKAVMVIDEAQDMDQDEFNLIRTMMVQNEEMRVIAVGDDDQNIYEFRGASSEYLEKIMRVDSAVKHELVENYRSKKNLVEFTNEFVKKIQHRLKHEPIAAKQEDDGRIKLVSYRSKNLITPVVQDIVTTDLTGTTCVLTKTNDEALQVTGLLLRNRVPAKLIQTNDGFNLYDLLEVRFFLSHLNLAERVALINQDLWEQAKRELKDRFQQSSTVEICLNIIRDFEATHPKHKYKSDLEVFIRESKLEDFFNERGETIFVSTIHKAKGREFNNVFLLLEDFDPSTDVAKRQLYVAMTRAKQNLTIHLNGKYLDDLTATNLERVEDRNVYSPSVEMVMHLTHKDVWLDYFINKQHALAKCRSGDALTLGDGGCLNERRQPVLKFSRQFEQKIESWKEKGYRLKSAKVNFVLYWRPENSDKDFRILLPELCFERGKGKSA